MAKAFQRSYKFLPEVFQTNLNRKFLSSTMDQLVIPGDPRQLNYYVGRKYASSTKVTDRFLSESNNLRNAYQLETGAAVLNPDGTYSFGATVEDFINLLGYYGVDKDNIQNILADDFKPADFKINLDKLVNFEEYYWLPNGPEAITLSFASANLIYTKLSKLATGVTGSYDNNYFYVTTNNKPAAPVDSFPNTLVDRSIIDNTVTFKIPMNPQLRSTINPLTAVPAAGMIGVAVNGHPFYTYTMGSKEKLGEETYTINTVFLENNAVSFSSTAINQYNGFNRDEDLLHVSPTDFAGHPDLNGVFHYHAFTSELDDNLSGHSKILGYAFDGFPIYGPRGYLNADGSGGVVRMTTSYRLKGTTAARGTPDGRYVEDYEYVAGLGLLDANNGRFTVTPEYPNGTYAYFLTIDALGAPEFPYALGPYWSGTPIQQSGTVQVPNNVTTFNGIPTIDVDRDIVGQQRFSLGDVTFINGLKIKFDTTTLPASYRNKEYYVEGVGNRIELLPVQDLLPNGQEVATNYVRNIDGYDYSSFDSTDYNGISYNILDKHYITIARNSQDGNAWSRSNRWFHSKVIKHTAEVLNRAVVLDLTQKAKRPIIEFTPDLCLYNHARKNVAVVNLFDQIEVDALSNVNAANGYNADGVTLQDGMRVVFAADNDPLVRSKIYQVTIAQLDEGRKSVYSPSAIGTTPYEWLPVNTGDVFNIQGDFRNCTLELKQNGAILQNIIDYTYEIVYNIPSMIDITVTNGGSGYVSAPTVSLYDYYGNLISNTAATASVSAGAVTAITINDPTLESSYVSIVVAPPPSGITATAAAAIGVEKRVEITLTNTALTLADIELTAFQYEPNVVLTEVGSVTDYEGVVVAQGNSNLGKNFYYLNDSWYESQGKTEINQEPLFDLFDTNLTSIGDRGVYIGSTFIGTKLFSYKRGTGANDTELGFPLSYKAVGLTGDIQFQWDHSIDVFNFTSGALTNELACESFYALNTKDNTLRSVVLDSNRIDKLPALDLRYIDVATDTVLLKATVEDSSEQQTILVELNDKPVYRGVDYDLVEQIRDSRDQAKNLVRTVTPNSKLVFKNKLNVGDKLLITFWTNDSIANTDLSWKLPLSLTSNPSNTQISNMTFGELVAHLSSGAQLLTSLEGRLVGDNNLFVQPTVNNLCSKFGYHNGNILLAMALLKNRTMGFVQSLEYARNEFTKFKNSIIQRYDNVTFDEENPIPSMLDNLLSDYVLGRTVDFPFYDSDMVPGFTNYVETNYTVQYQQDKTYPISSTYVDDETSKTAVLVYHNGTLLTRYKHYDFSATLPSLTIVPSYQLSQGDTIKVREYSTTDANWIAVTPTKLGLAPSYEPGIISIQQPSGTINVIVGHDGSQTPAFGDQRDDLLLELENRIYNNIKKSNQGRSIKVLERFKSLPGNYRSTAYEFDNYINIVDRFFGQWILKSKLNYTANSTYDSANSWTWNYRGQLDAYGNKSPVGNWHAINRYYFDTVYPNKTPWEMLGFHEEPTWWESEYGSAPYTSQNYKLWDDLEQGLIRSGERAGIDLTYARKNLNKPAVKLQAVIPVDEHGNLLPPDESGLISITDRRLLSADWIFGDGGPVEQAWIRSSEFEFTKQLYYAISTPRFYFGSAYDLLDTQFDSNTNTLQKVYNTSITSLGKVLRQQDIKDSVQGPTSGYFVWVKARAKSLNIDSTEFVNFVSGICPRLLFRMTGFTDKDKLQIFINSVAPGSTNAASLLPDSNYQLLLDQSSPTKSLIYSGVIVTRTANGWRIDGYDTEKTYFYILPSIKDQGNKDTIRVGETSSDFLTWSPGNFYLTGQIVRNAGLYYKVNSDHTSTETFTVGSLYTLLNELPLKGGVVATLWKGFETTPVKIYYGTNYKTAQEVFDFLISYGRYLESQGFMFDQYDADAGELRTWVFSGKEFLFWTLQNWNTGSSITLSPASELIQIYIPQGEIDPLYGVYSDPDSVLDQNGRPLRASDIAVDRNFDVATIAPTGNSAIYLLKGVVSEFDHLVVFDDKTDFNDIIFDPTTGARQERLKVKGSKSNGWNGKLFAPGYTLDQANILEWQKYNDYRIGDLAKVGNTVYSANSNHNSGELFDYAKWTKLAKQPSKFLQPNLETLAARLEQFYDLSVDQITSDVSAYARHLIGFQPRDYLSALLVDDETQFKFYQGMITQKGTEQAVTKLLRSMNTGTAPAVDIKDEWAFRIGEFGLADNTDEVEIDLYPSDLEFNKVALDLLNSPSYERNVVPVPATQILDKGELESPYFFQTRTAAFPQKYAGYARTDQVDVAVLSKDQLSTINTNVINATGRIIWIAKTASTESEIYRTQRFGPFTISILANDVIELDQPLDLALNENIWFVTLEDLNYTNVSAPGQLQPVPGINGYEVVNTIETKTRFTIKNETGLALGDTFTAFIVKLQPVEYPTFNTVAIDTINSVSNTNPAVVSFQFDHSFVGGERVFIDDVSGMTEVNAQVFYVKYESSNSVSLYYDMELTNPVNSQAYSAYTSGGKTYSNHIGIAERINDLPINSRLWVDNYTNGWAVFKKQDAWVPSSQPEGLVPFTTNINLMGRQLHAWSYKSINWVASRATATTIPNKTDDVVLVYERSQADLDLNFVATLRGDTADVSLNSNFGYSISNLDDSTLIVGCPTNSIIGTNYGSVQIYNRGIAGNWTLGHTVHAPVGASNAKFGTTLARINNNLLLIGAPGQSALYKLKYGSFNLPVKDLTVSAYPTPISLTFGIASCVTTNTSAYVTTASSLTGIEIGTQVSGTGIQANTVITNIEINYTPGVNRITLSRTATATGTITLNLYHGLSDGQAVKLTDVTGVIKYTGSALNNGTYYVLKVNNFTVSLYEEENLTTPVVGFGTHTQFTGLLAVTDSYSIQLAPTTQLLASAARAGIALAADSNKVAVTDTAGNGHIYVYTIDEYGILTHDVGGTATGTAAIPIQSLHPVDITTVNGTIRVALGARFTTFDTYGLSIDGGGTTFDTTVIDGLVRIYNFTYSSGAELTQILTAPTLAGLNLFGKSIKFTDSGKLLVGNPTAPYKWFLSFDSATTSFDDATTSFYDVINDFGAVESYGWYKDQYIWEDSIYNPISSVVDPSTGFGSSLTQVNNTIFTASPWADAGVIYEYNNVGDGWIVESSEETVVDTDLTNRALSYDPINDQVVEFLSLWDPIKGLHDSEALINIDYTTFKDPSIYQEDSPGNSYWAAEKVGTIWWNDANAIWTWYEQGDLSYRLKNWGQLFPGSTIQVCEWIESSVVPAAYNSGNTIPELGLPPNGSGQSYNTVVTTDNNGGAVFRYYFWVANKQTISQSSTKTLSAGSIATLLTNGPYQWVAAASQSGIVTQGLRDNFVADRQILQIEVLRDVQNNPRHVEWTLLSEGDSEPPPSALVSKMIDSLTGKNELGNLVPDLSLAAHKKLGIKIRPRQTMFDDRVAAIEASSEYINEQLAKLILEDINLGDLNAIDPLPLQSEIVDILLDEGDTLFDDGETVFLSSFTNWNESVPTYADIIQDDLLAKDVGYSILVVNDENRDNLWTVYTWDGLTLILVKVQKYDTTRYWSRVDYYSTDFPQGTVPDYTIATEQQFLDTAYSTTDKVKVLGPGYWRVLRKTDTGDSEILAMQNGTIRLDITAKDFNTTLSFDTTSYDSTIFDPEPTIELRNILNAMRDNIFVGENQYLWNSWFFRMVRHAFSEQRQLDWAFKSSFIKVKNMVANLEERPVYALDVEDSLEKYINEVKPYHTKIREYTSVYSGNDLFDSLTTDFDCPPHLENNRYVTSNVNDENQLDLFETKWPWRGYRDNRGYEIVAIVVTDGGSGYVSQPVVSLNGGTTLGRDNARLATARALLGSPPQTFDSLGKDNYFSFRKLWLDKQAETDTSIDTTDLPGDVLANMVGTDSYAIKSIEIVDSGQGYLTPPEVIISGGGGTGARAYAVLGRSPVRMFKTGIKFDRVKGTSDRLYSDMRATSLDNPGFDDWHAASRIAAQYEPQPEQAGIPERITLTYTGDGVTTTYTLPQDFMYEEYLQVATKSVDAANDEYELLASTEYIVYPSELQIEFNTAPASGVTIALILNPPLLPLMIGADFDQTKIVSPKFPAGPGFDSQTRGFDSVEFDNWELDPNGDIVELTGFDTYLNGGRFASITGYDPSTDIIGSGGSFIGPETTPSTEELVSGQIFDTVDIKVFTKPALNQEISIQSFTSDGSTTSYELVPAPGSADNVVIFVNGAIQDDESYTLDYNISVGLIISTTLIFDTAPSLGSIITAVITQDQGPTVEQVQNFKGDGTTVRFRVSGAGPTPTLPDIRETIVIVDGIKVTPAAVTDDGNDVIVDLSSAPANNAAVRIVVYLQTQGSPPPDIKNYAESFIDSITFDNTISTYALTHVSGVPAPTSASTIVYAINSGNSGERLVPPDTSYYIGDGINDVFLLPDCPGFDKTGLTNSDVEVAVNGEVLSTLDYTVNVITDDVTLATPPLLNDVVTITISISGDYYVSSGNLIINDLSNPKLADGIKLIVNTFNDTALNEMRTEVFAQSSALHLYYNGFGVYKATVDPTYYNLINYYLRSQIRLSRAILAVNQVNIYKNGIFLLPGTDWAVEPGTDDVINIGGGINDTDVIVVHYFTGSSTSNIIGFRLFKDMLGNFEYYRMPEENSARVTQQVSTSDDVIYLDSTAGLLGPAPQANRPGVVMLGKERVEYWEMTSNSIRRLRRGTKGTGAGSHVPGTIAVDMTARNVPPSSDTLLRSTYTANGSTTTYALPVTLTTADHDDQSIQVYVAGKKVTSGYTVGITGLDYTHVIFDVAPKTGLTVLIMIKQASNWYDITNPTLGLVDTNTAWAEFVREKSAVIDI